MEKQIFNKPGKYEVSLQLNKESQELEWMGIVEAREAGDYELSLKINHTEPKTKGNVTVKGVAKNGARVRITGLVVVDQKAENSDSSLVMKMLLADKKSMAEVDPKMEILTNKVKASHAASVSRIDDEQLFYLESRGIEKKEAEKMIIKGFIH